MLLALHILADCVELLDGRRIARHNVNRAYLCPLVGNDRVFAQQLDAHVTDEYRNAGGQHTDDRIDVHLNDDPGTGAGDAHGGDQNERLGPVVDGESLLPVKSARARYRFERGYYNQLFICRSPSLDLLVGSFHFVRRIAHLALEHFVRFAAALHQPATQTLVMHGAHVSRAFAGLNQRLALIVIVAYPAVFADQKRLSLLGR